MSIFDYDLVGVIQHKSSNGQCTNPLIRFDLIGGLAVGFVIAYPVNLDQLDNRIGHQERIQNSLDENEEYRQKVQRKQERQTSVEHPKQP